MEVADLELGQIVFAETLQDGEYSGRVQVRSHTPKSTSEWEQTIRFTR